MLNKSQKKKVMHFDDERAIGNSIIVTLNYGWCFTSDPLVPMHVEGFDTIKDAKEGINSAVKCECKECVENLKPEEV